MKADLPEPGGRRFGLFRRRSRGSRRAAKPDRDTVRAIEEFVRTRQGVEAYVEPETATARSSVVLVAADGEWIRKEVPDARWLEKLSRAARVPVYDASRVGYPRRMRQYRRPDRGGA